jgi:hypothetical protein
MATCGGAFGNHYLGYIGRVIAACNISLVHRGGQFMFAGSKRENQDWRYKQP